MTETNVTLSALLGLDGKRESENDVSAVESSNCFEQVKEQLGEAAGKNLPPGFWSVAASEILGALREKLNTPLGEILGGVWSKYADFLEYADPKRHPAGERSVVPLVKHTISYEKTPHVDVLAGGKKLGSIDFTVNLALTLHGANVAVQDGRFVALHTGQYEFEATLKCESQEILKRTSKDYKLPGEILFGSGVPIVPSGGRHSPIADAGASVSSARP